MLLNLIRGATLRPFRLGTADPLLLLLLGGLPLTILVENLNKVLVAHLVHIMLRVLKNIEKHPVHQIIVNIIENLVDSFSNLHKVYDSSVFVIFLRQGVVQCGTVFSEFLSEFYYHLDVGNLVGATRGSHASGLGNVTWTYKQKVVTDELSKALGNQGL